MKKLTSMLLFAAAVCSAAPPAKVSADLANADPQSTVRVIVQWNSAPDSTKHQKVLARGGALQSTLLSIKAGVYTVPAQALSGLANDPDVAYIATDRPVRAKLDYTAAAINASASWSAGWTGEGIGVAVLDSGMNQDPNLSKMAGFGSRIVFSKAFVAAAPPVPGAVPAATTSTSASLGAVVGGVVSALGVGPGPVGPLAPAPLLPTSQPGQDQFGHGQHVAGIIGANAYSSTCPNCTRSFVGMAPGV